MKWENFTSDRVAGYSCKSGKQQSIFWDGKTPGLGVRVTPDRKNAEGKIIAGAKSYIFETNLHGKTIRLTIGDVRTWTIGKAQTEATDLKAMTDKGIDPRKVKTDAIAAAAAQRTREQAETDAKEIQDRRELVTLGMAWLVYIAAKRSAKRKGGKIGWSEWHIRDHENVVSVGGIAKKRGKGKTEPGPLASLLDVRLSDLTGERIGTWLAAETTSRPTRAALAFRLLSVFVNWCNSHKEYAGLVPTGACRAEQVTNEIPAKNSKEGDSLQKEQLVPWFESVCKMPNKVQAAYLQALLLTGARRRELGALRWDDVDFQWLSMTIRDKVEGERTIPLTPYVSHLLNALPHRKDNPWVFSSPTSASGQLAEPTPGHKRALIAAGLPDLTLHGLRRSFGSLAEWTETPAGVVAQIMGHKPSAIAEKHYRRRPLDLLRMWHVKIEEWVLEQAGINFVPVEPGLHAVK
jgi:integrase